MNAKHSLNEQGGECDITTLPHPIIERFAFIHKVQTILWVAPVLRGRPAVFSRQECNRSARDPEAGGDY